MGVQCKAFGENLKARWDFSKLSFEAKTLYGGPPVGVHKSSGGCCILRFLCIFGSTFFFVQLNNVVH